MDMKTFKAVSAMSQMVDIISNSENFKANLDVLENQLVSIEDESKKLTELNKQIAVSRQDVEDKISRLTKLENTIGKRETTSKKVSAQAKALKAEATAELESFQAKTAELASREEAVVVNENVLSSNKQKFDDFVAKKTAELNQREEDLNVRSRRLQNALSN